jgi:hypothetical protein
MRRMMILASVLTCAALIPTSPANAAQQGTDVTIDFSTYGEGVFDPFFYADDGIVFASPRCGPSGCVDLFVSSLVQGDAALIGDSVFGPITARFAVPVTSLSVQVAPAFQGTATYTLSAYKKSGKVLARQSLTVTQDEGDPDPGPDAGYFPLTLDSLHKASSFSLDAVFVRSSSEQITLMEYGVSSIEFATGRLL